MLALAVSDALVLLEPSEIKKFSATPSLLPLAFSPVSSSWTGSNLYLAASDSIHLYRPTTKTFTTIYESFGIGHVVAQSPTALLFNSADKIHVLDTSKQDALGTVTRTIESHKRDITSLSLSNDLSLLASTSADAAYVHNLATGSSTALRGLPATSSQPITTSLFHPHTRTKLLLAVGRKLVISDISRPASPSKMIALSDSSQGDINCITCSPFSKTLVAVSTSAGYVSLVDLDKEKSVFRTIHLDTSLSGIHFAADGACIYAGTETGELLVIDLRSLDHSPHSIAVGQSGQKLQTMSVQTRQTSVANTARPKSSASVRPVEGSPSPPARPRNASLLVPDPITRRTSGTHSSKPPRSPLRESVVANSSLSPGLRTSRAPKTPVRSDKKSPSTSVAQAKIALRKATPSPATRRTAAADAHRARRSSTVTDNPSAASSARIRASRLVSISDVKRPRAVSSATGPGIVRAKPATRPSSRPGPSAASTRLGLPGSLPEDVSSSSTSFNIPETHQDPTTPPPMKKKKNEFAALGLGTPLAHRRTSSEVESKPSVKGKGKVVEFCHDEADEESPSEASDDEEVRLEMDRARSLSMQISPMRPPQAVRPSASWVPSPLRQPMSPSPGPGSGGSAQDFLRGIVRDAMFEYQQETKSELTGLHLDLMRVGRGWKKEMREMMDEYMGELRELRDENKTLREENERLRRGY